MPEGLSLTPEGAENYKAPGTGELEQMVEPELAQENIKVGDEMLDSEIKKAIEHSRTEFKLRFSDVIPETIGMISGSATFLILAREAIENPHVANDPKLLVPTLVMSLCMMGGALLAAWGIKEKGDWINKLNREEILKNK